MMEQRFGRVTPAVKTAPPQKQKSPEATARPSAREQAFEAIFHAHYARVHGVLCRLLGDPAEAEDVALEAFWQLWQNPPSDMARLGGWLYRVATRLGLNALRAARRRQNYEGIERFTLNPAQRETEQVAEQHLDQARVRATLSQLPERDAQLLMLRHSGLSYQEIAAALHLAPGSVGTLLARAEAAFLKRYGLP